MASNSIPRTAIRVLIRKRPSVQRSKVEDLSTRCKRSIQYKARIPAVTASNVKSRPKIQHSQQILGSSLPTVGSGRRTIFIQTEETPNADVRTAWCWISPLAYCLRHSNFFRTTRYCPPDCHRLSLNTSPQDLLWLRRIPLRLPHSS